jgi:hypothetical protein
MGTHLSAINDFLNLAQSVQFDLAEGEDVVSAALLKRVCETGEECVLKLVEDAAAQEVVIADYRAQLNAMELELRAKGDLWYHMASGLFLATGRAGIVILCAALGAHFLGTFGDLTVQLLPVLKALGASTLFFGLLTLALRSR